MNIAAAAILIYKILLTRSSAVTGTGKSLLYVPCAAWLAGLHASVLIAFGFLEEGGSQKANHSS